MPCLSILRAQLHLNCKDLILALDGYQTAKQMLNILQIFFLSHPTAGGIRR